MGVKEIFDMNRNKDDKVLGKKVSKMIKSMGFFVSEKQVDNFLDGVEFINLEQFQNFVNVMEREQQILENQGLNLFTRTVDWKRTKKVSCTKLKEICCCYGDKLSEEEWQELMLLINPKRFPVLQIANIIESLAWKPDLT